MSRETVTRSRRLAAAPPVPSWTAPGAAPRRRSASVDVAATTPRRPGRGALRRRPPSAAATRPRPSRRRWRARLNDIASVIAELSYPAAWRYALRSVNAAMGWPLKRAILQSRRRSLRPSYWPTESSRERLTLNHVGSSFIG